MNPSNYGINTVLGLIFRVLIFGAPIILIDFFYTAAHQQYPHEIKAEPDEGCIGCKMLDLLNFLHLLGSHKADAQTS